MRIETKQYSCQEIIELMIELTASEDVPSHQVKKEWSHLYYYLKYPWQGKHLLVSHGVRKRERERDRE